MSWIFDHLGLIVFLAVGYSLWRKAKIFLRQISEETERRTRTRSPGNHDPAEAQRVREIQEEIRRKIAERRGGDQRATRAPQETGDTSPPLHPTNIPPLDPFGGRIGRVMAELERRVQTAAPSETSEASERPRGDAAQLVRQEQLTEQLRVLEETRAFAARRAAQTAATIKTEAASESGLRALSRENLLAELRDPRSLRRAFVLREVLGAPVGLR